MIRGPLLPRSQVDPTGQNPRVRAAEDAFKSRLAQAAELTERVYLPTLRSSSLLVANAERYEYLLDPKVLAFMNEELNRLVESIFLEGGPDALWFAQEYVIPAYQMGTAQQMANLGVQSEVYAASRPNIAAIINSAPYQRRIGYLRARMFEEMRGFSADVSKSVALELAQGMAMGKNPLDVARSLADVVEGGLARAERIARTEINNALRQARLDEADQVTRDLGLLTREMHISAFSPTSRASHEARHGTIHTSAEQRTWWATGANSINCKCTTVTILVNAQGQPLMPGIVARAQQVREKVLARRAA